MFVTRFLITDRNQVWPHLLDRIYMVDLDGVPWRSRNVLQEGCLAVHRDVDGSGRLYLPWHVEGYGCLTLCTTTLMVREEPYHLTVELARGTLHRLRNQLAEWEGAGMVINSHIFQTVRQATSELVRSIMLQRDDTQAASESANQSLRYSLGAIRRLCADYTEQSLAYRHRITPELSSILAVNLGEDSPEENRAKPLRELLNAAAISPLWRQIEPAEGERDWGPTDRQMQWCQQQGLPVCMGPVLQFGKRDIPDWLYHWEGDFESLEPYIRDHVEATIERYRGQVHLWHATAKMNTVGELLLSEEQKLRLTAIAIETIRQRDPNAAVIVSFNQPWGEYLGQESWDLSPWYSADALVRAEIGLAGIGLEINLGYWPGGTLPRDPLEISTQIDHWSTLGLPLLIFLTIPSSATEDPHAEGRIQPMRDAAPTPLSPRSQQKIAHWLVPLLLAKQGVQGVIWNQLDDQANHTFPNGGLFDSQGKAKPTLDFLTAFRKEHLL